MYFGSRDGWITKYDIYNLKVVAEVRAGINMRNIAVSADGNYVLAANYLPHSMVLFDAANLEMLDFIPVENDAGESSRVSAVYTAPPRGSFIAALCLEQDQLRGREQSLSRLWHFTLTQQDAACIIGADAACGGMPPETRSLRHIPMALGLRHPWLRTVSGGIPPQAAFRHRVIVIDYVKYL
ncbi:hypothetical protein Q666_05100 [Marinobacter sp. ES-1]|nr:hypothetical protein Q666_05100 [Marinobacter sp. ES-1]